MVWKRRKNVEIRGISSWIASSSRDELWSCVSTWTPNFAYDADPENATEPARSIVKVWGNVIAWKSFPYHQCLLMFPMKNHLMSQQCIGRVLDPDVEPLLSHHENLRMFQQDSTQFHATRQRSNLSMCKEWMWQSLPAYGPRLIPLELLWDQIGRGVGSRLEHPRARAQMIESL